VRQPGNPEPRRRQGRTISIGTAARSHARRPLPRATATRRTSAPLHTECGAGSKFGRPFRQWIKDGTPKTMGAVADEWVVGSAGRRWCKDGPDLRGRGTLPVG
jgi:hypothetical protein